jgi:hypothetical protein
MLSEKKNILIFTSNFRHTFDECKTRLNGGVAVANLNEWLVICGGTIETSAAAISLKISID